MLAAHALFCHGRHSGQQSAVWMSAQSGEADDSPSCTQPSAMPVRRLDEAAQRQTRSWDLHRGSQASVMLYFMTRQTPSCLDKNKEGVHSNVHPKNARGTQSRSIKRRQYHGPALQQVPDSSLLDRARHLKHSTAQRSTAQRSTAQHSMTQHSTAHAAQK